MNSIRRESPLEMEASERIEIVQLSDKHEKEKFNCGNEALNLFLHRYAKQNVRKGLSVTYVAVKPNDNDILGYYCLSTGQVACSTLPEKDARRLPRYPIPVVRIGRLAVRSDSQGGGIGGLLLVDALKKALRVSEEIGVFAVEVDAKTEEAKRFYLKYGFSELEDDDLHLYLSMTTVRRLFGAK